MQSRHWTGLITICLCSELAGSAFATPFLEGIDAGQTVESAQELALVGPVDVIAGRIDNAFDVDLYRLIVDEPEVFSAIAAPGATEAPNLQLFLFDRWGRGIVANDNWDFKLSPSLPFESLAGHQPGEYLLGVAPADNDPTCILGEIFPDLTEGLSRPDQLRRGMPLTGWTRDFRAAAGNYEIVLTAASGTIAPLPADFDIDGDVDQWDLATWQRGYGVGTLHEAGDATFDGDVDGEDFLVWQRLLGLESPAAGIQLPIPEPTTLGLCALSLASLITWSRRNKH